MMRHLFQVHSEADRRGVPAEVVQQELKDRAEAEALLRHGALSRRAFIERFGAVGAAAVAITALTPLPKMAKAATEARVVIIGAGLAGLRCADVLAQHGIAADIYEAADRIGGRVFSDTTSFDGLLTERGGSFISTEHSNMRNLARRMNLDLEVINGGALLDGEEIYWIDGDFYSFEEANDDWRVAWKAFKEDLQAAPFPMTFESFTERGQELESITTPEWFDPASPFSHPILADFGPDSRLAKLCYASVMAEYGPDADLQPALNLLYIMGFNTRNSIAPLPGTDEVYHIEGGNERLIHALAEGLPGTIHSGKPLEAISTLSGDPFGPYVCHFADGSSAVADKLVLTLPFQILRQLNIAPEIFDNLSPQKQQAIAQLDLGPIGKVHLELAQRTWGPDAPVVFDGEEHILDGLAYSDPDGFQLVWDDSVPLEDGPVVRLHYLSGTQGSNLKGNTPFGPASPSDVNRLLRQVEPVFPGSTAAFTGRAVQSSWIDHPWAGGALTT